MATTLEILLSKAKMAVAPERLTKRYPIENNLHLLACLCREESRGGKATFFLTRPQIQKLLGIPLDIVNRYMGILFSEGFLLLVERAKMVNGVVKGNIYRWIEGTEEDDSICLDDYIPWP